MIPPFRGDGALPEGRHVATAREVEQHFVQAFPTSITRKGLHDGWRRRRERLIGLIPIDMEWIDGSFVTAKRDPGDVDVVSFLQGDLLDGMDPARRSDIMELVYGATPRVTFGCDSYFVAVRPVEHPQRALYERARGYWDDWWSRSRTGVEKGYVDVRGEA